MREKPIIFSQHALDQLHDRGTSQDEVEQAIRQGEEIPAKKGRLAFRKNFPFQSEWNGKYYEIKQVMPIVIEEPTQIVVITVYVFYIGGKL
ncbi:MAG: DUF4258 domain-containing protein [candidate division WOR-3 bacterium]|nr:DUF4258 domain-containing protein [candidate division WOR-3 bacterium]